MRRVITIAVLAGAIVAVSPASLSALSATPFALPLLHRTSLLYQGAFRLPAPQGDRKTFDYGGTALAYDPARNALFVVGHDWYQLTAEVSIPRPVRSSGVSRLPRAKYLQRFA